MSSRELILFNIREANSKAPIQVMGKANSALPATPYANPRFEGKPLDELIRRMAAVQISLEFIDNLNWVPGAVTAYLEERDLDISETQMDISPELASLEWIDSPSIRFGAARAESAIAVTTCIAAVAETGSIVMASGPEHPVGLSFLPDCHIVVLPESAILPYMEDVWPLLREYDQMPRVINFNTGPSRTGDIEQTIEIGAHGPRAMHVLLVKDI